MKNHKNLKETIENTLEKGKTKEVLEIIRENSSVFDADQSLLITAEYNTVEEQFIRGTIDLEGFNFELNKIRYRILLLIQNTEYPSELIEEVKKVYEDETEEFSLNKIHKILTDKVVKKEDLLLFSRTVENNLLLIYSKEDVTRFTKSDIAYHLIKFLDNKKEIPRLLDWLQSRYPTEYYKYQPYIFEKLEASNNEKANQLDKILSKLNQFKIYLPPKKEPRIMIAGNYGNGKTTTINTIFGEKVGITSSSKRGTVTPKDYEWSYKDNSIYLIDLPGLGDKPEKDNTYIDLYKKRAKESDGIIIIIAPPRPAGLGTVKTIRAFLDAGVPAKKLIFGLNRLKELSYDDINGEEKSVEIRGLRGAIKNLERKAIEELKFDFISELKEEFPKEEFKIEQIIEYDAKTGWNLYNLLFAVLEILPYNTLYDFEKKTQGIRTQLKKYSEAEKMENEIIAQEEEFSKRLANKWVNGIEELLEKVSPKVANKFKEIKTELVNITSIGVSAAQKIEKEVGKAFEKAAISMWDGIKKLVIGKW